MREAWDGRIGTGGHPMPGPLISAAHYRAKATDATSLPA